jgi:hypothetical protein
MHFSLQRPLGDMLKVAKRVKTGVKSIPVIK